MSLDAPFRQNSLKIKVTSYNNILSVDEFRVNCIGFDQFQHFLHKVRSITCTIPLKICAAVTIILFNFYECLKLETLLSKMPFEYLKSLCINI